ncbi:MAG: DUF2283 domain-containing protein [Anaerolineae bacterium]|nr:DUF2283 domain-containing protein [Anaerolineae bacterium]
MDKVTQLFYDREADVLYLSIGEPRRAISREIGDDVLLRIDAETETVIGLTIMNLSTRFGELDSPQSLPITIDLHESAS